MMPGQLLGGEQVPARKSNGVRGLIGGSGGICKRGEKKKRDTHELSCFGVTQTGDQDETVGVKWYVSTTTPLIKEGRGEASWGEAWLMLAVEDFLFSLPCSLAGFFLFFFGERLKFWDPSNGVLNTARCLIVGGHFAW
jgi:hypothetical protein